MRLFEFGDQPWFPKILRDGETAYLAIAYKALPLARAWVDRMLAVLHRAAASLSWTCVPVRAVHSNRW
jgi:hypothetical protein